MTAFPAGYCEPPGIVADSVFAGFEGTTKYDQLHRTELSRFMMRLPSECRGQSLGDGMLVIFLVAIVGVICRTGGSAIENQAKDVDLAAFEDLQGAPGETRRGE